MNPEVITSAQNPKLKRLLALQEKSRLRREEGVFVVEGRRELEHCVAAGFEIEAVFICPEILEGQALPPEGVRPSDSPHHPVGTVPPLSNRGCYVPQGVVPALSNARQLFHLTKELYSKVAYREGTEGIIAEVKAKYLGLEDLKLKENPLVMVLEGVEKPGNLGAVLRSADAAGADAVIICDPLTDLYNPNLIRASIGAVFTVPVACCTSEEAIAFLKARGIRILTAQLQDSSPYYDVDMRTGTALVMGTEATGLTPVWRAAADAHILIPMLGRLDSLNVSVSAAILLYEAVRQRQ
ncbi:MAG: RNA methyltransferase [Bacteroidales bacterium]|nr:RNA methyltransferase [Bacteroidales bacterium]